jgi:hypothetical protein
MALGVFFLLLFFFSPAWSALRLQGHAVVGHMIEIRRGHAVLAQMNQPGAPVEDVLHAVIQWRILFPAIGHFLGLSPVAFFSLAPIGAILTLGYLVILLRRHALNWLDTAFAVFSFGGCAWFFTTTGWLGYFDAWVILALLLVSSHPSSVVLAIACVLTPWIDERFVMAAPLALLCRYLFISHVSSRSSSHTYRLGIDLILPAIIVAIFVYVRLGVLGGASSGGATIRGYLEKQKMLNGGPLIAWGIWEGLRASWLFVACAIVIIWRRSSNHGALLVLALFSLALIGLITAQDYGRSIAMLAPAAALGAVLLAQLQPSRLRPALAISAGITALVPGYHVMNDQAKPIFYLPYELTALKQLTQFDRPEAYQLHAMLLQEQGDFQNAEIYLANAIVVAKNPASAARQRGRLLTLSNRPKDALIDFSIALEYERGNPDAWLDRSKAFLAMGDKEAAKSDFEKARSLAPPAWLKRTDVILLNAELLR